MRGLYHCGDMIADPKGHIHYESCIYVFVCTATSGAWLRTPGGCRLRYVFERLALPTLHDYFMTLFGSDTSLSS